MSITLGLDLGVSSIGWCLQDANQQQIITAGSRVFQAGVESSPLGKESSWNATRTAKRQIRRQIFRKAERQELLINIFQGLGWLPKYDELVELIMAQDPYQLRKKALDEPLTLEELARVFYHLSKRRGFKSSRKSASDEEGKLFTGDIKVGKVGIDELRLEIAKGGFRTIGEYFASLNPHEKRIRNRYVLRSQYIEEFDKIWESQLRFHPDIEKPIHYEYVLRNFCKSRQQERWEKQSFYHFLKDYVIYFQRALKSQKKMVGFCSLEPESKRTPLSNLAFQEFRILDKLNSFRIVGPNRNYEPLTPLEKEVAFQKLNQVKEQTVEQLFKLWYLDANFSANYDRSDKVVGNKTAHGLISIFGKAQWETLSETERNKRWKVIYDANDNTWLKQYAATNWLLTPAQQDKLAKLSFEKGYGSLSQKALTKLLPLMKSQNFDFSKACKEVGYHHSQKVGNTITKDLLSPFTKKINSPIVSQGLHELRKVINTLIQEYAIKPDCIRIELARELKMPKEKRENITKDNKAREIKHKAIIQELVNNSPNFVSEYEIKPDDIIKYKLWEECKHICPYTGNQIGLTDLFDDNKYQIEHILPYSRSLDNSFQNKTLCEANFNRKKGDLMPYEMYQKGIISKETYETILERAKQLIRDGKRNTKKFERFILRQMPQDMVAQQLNDTQFLAVAAKEYLLQICSNIEISMGAVTAQLRKLWGLNSVLNPIANVKNRDDHRHHALDAIVIANTTPRMIQLFSKYNQKGTVSTTEKFPLPWGRFRLDTKEALEKILVSHKQNNRVRGQLHDETMWGKVKAFDGSHRIDEKNATQKIYTTRIPLNSITDNNKVDKIADRIVREVVKKRLAEKGVDTTQKKYKVPNDAFVEPLWMPNKKNLKIPIHHVRIHDKSTNKIEIRKDTFVDSGSNHHIVIYQKPDGKRNGTVVSLYEAHQRKLRKEPIINTDCGEDNEFIVALSTNDMVLLDSEHFQTDKIDWQNPDYTLLSENLYRVQKLTDGEITFRHHLTAVLKNDNGIEIGRVIKSPNTFRGLKVMINSIGEIQPA